MFKKESEFNYLKFIIITIVIILAIFIVSFISAITLNENKTNSNNTVNKSDSKIIPGVVSIREQIEKEYYPASVPNSPTLGNKNAPIIIYEFADFGCEYSVKMQPILKSVLDKNKDKIQIVFRDLPSEKALLAHIAARCAQKQNKFWEYGDLLWKSQKDFSQSNLIKLAEKLKLNKNDFSSCLSDKNIEDLINKDITEADSLNIVGTPHFYIGKEEILGLATEAELQKIINQELK